MSRLVLYIHVTRAIYFQKLMEKLHFPGKKRVTYKLLHEQI